MRDFRFWWALFVLFLVLSLLVVQRGYRRWRIARDVVGLMPPSQRAEVARGLAREGWRLGWMALSLVVMIALVFAALLGAPPALILGLRVGAVLAVAAVVRLSLRRGR